MENGFAKCYTAPWIASSVLPSEKLAQYVKLLDKTLFPQLAKRAQGQINMDVQLVSTPDGETVACWKVQELEEEIEYKAYFAMAVRTEIYRMQTLTATIKPKDGKECVFTSYSEMTFTAVTRLIKILFANNPLMKYIAYNDNYKDVLRYAHEHSITLAAFAMTRQRLSDGENKMHHCELELRIKNTAGLTLNGLQFPDDIAAHLRWFNKENF